MSTPFAAPKSLRLTREGTSESKLEQPTSLRRHQASHTRRLEPPHDAHLISSLPLTGSSGTPIGMRCCACDVVLRGEGERSSLGKRECDAMVSVLVVGEKRLGEPNASDVR